MPNNPAVEELINQIKPYLRQYLEIQGIRPNGKGQFRCFNPGAHNHGDKNASASIIPNGQGYNCFGCGISGDIFTACNHFEGRATKGKEFIDTLKHLADIFHLQHGLDNQKPRKKSINQKYVKETEYIYTDINNSPIYKIVRMVNPENKKDKQFYPYMYDSLKGNYDKTSKFSEDCKRELYRLVEVNKAIEAEDYIFFVEGEKCVEILKNLGLTATCISGGANAWKKPHSNRYVTSLCNAKVVVLPDNDSAGRKFANQVAKDIMATANIVKVLELNGLPPKGDIEQWLRLDDSHTREKLLELCETAKSFSGANEYNRPSNTAITGSDSLPEFIITDHNGIPRVNAPLFSKYLKMKFPIKVYANTFRIFDNGYYKSVPNIASIAYMELPDEHKSHRHAETAIKNLLLDSELLLMDGDIADNRYISFKNGVYNISEKELLPHNKDLVFLSQVPFNFEHKPLPKKLPKTLKGAGSLKDDIELTEMFINTCADNDPEMRKLLLQIVGVLISDIRTFKNWIYFYGAKDTAKSTFLNMLKKLLTSSSGDTHYSSLSITHLDETCFYLYKILGMKANIDSDVSDVPIKGTIGGTLKKLTSGHKDTISCIQKGINGTSDALNTAMLLFAGNDVPKIWLKGDKSAFLDRMMLITFKNVISKDKIILDIENYINYEYLIQLAIAELHSWIADGNAFIQPKSIIDSRESVKLESDDLYNFFTHNIKIVKNATPYKTSDIYEFFCYWCKEEGLSDSYSTNNIHSRKFALDIQKDPYNVLKEKTRAIDGKPTRAYTNIEITDKDTFMSFKEQQNQRDCMETASKYYKEQRKY